MLKRSGFTLCAGLVLLAACSAPPKGPYYVLTNEKNPSVQAFVKAQLIETREAERFCRTHPNRSFVWKDDYVNDAGPTFSDWKCNGAHAPKYWTFRGGGGV